MKILKAVLLTLLFFVVVIGLGALLHFFPIIGYVITGIGVLMIFALIYVSL